MYQFFSFVFKCLINSYDMNRLSRPMVVIVKMNKPEYEKYLVKIYNHVSSFFINPYEY